MSSGLELDDRRRKIGKATDPSLRTVQSTGLATARADLDRGKNANLVKAFFAGVIKLGLVGAVLGGAYFAYQKSEKDEDDRAAAVVKAQDEKKAAERFPEKAPKCFVSNAGYYFRYKDAKGRWKEARTIEQVPLKKRRRAQCRAVKPRPGAN